MLHSAPVETDLFADLLSLVEHCVRNVVGDGMPRTPGLIELTTLGGAWVVSIIDPDLVRWVRVIAVTLDMALQLAAALLKCGDPPWVPIPKASRK